MDSARNTVQGRKPSSPVYWFLHICPVQFHTHSLASLDPSFLICQMGGFNENRISHLLPRHGSSSVVGTVLKWWNVEQHLQPPPTHVRRCLPPIGTNKISLDSAKHPRAWGNMLREALGLESLEQSISSKPQLSTGMPGDTHPAQTPGPQTSRHELPKVPRGP